MLAARKNLQPTVVEALLGRMRPDGLPALAGNLSINLSSEAIRYLVENAHGNPRLARLLAARMDDVAGHRPHRPVPRPRWSRPSSASSRRWKSAALREFAARRPLARVPMPNPDKVATLARACLQRNVEAMSRILSDLTGLDAPFLVRLLADSGGEPLSICLKGIWRRYRHRHARHSFLWRRRHAELLRRQTSCRSLRDGVASLWHSCWSIAGVA